MSVNFYTNYNVSMGSRRKSSKIYPNSNSNKKNIKDNNFDKLLQPFAQDKKAIIPSLKLMKGINPNQKNVFDTFKKIDDVTRNINFVKSQQAWDDCLLEEIEEFKVARQEYQTNKTQQNFDHMQEEMGDIFYTAASIAKDSGIDDPEEAFRTTNRKFFNRISLMERLCNDKNLPASLDKCQDYQRRALWNAAKRKLYDAQIAQYTQIPEDKIEFNLK